MFDAQTQEPVQLHTGEGVLTATSSSSRVKEQKAANVPEEEEEDDKADLGALRAYIFQEEDILEGRSLDSITCEQVTYAEALRLYADIDGMREQILDAAAQQSNVFLPKRSS